MTGSLFGCTQKAWAGIRLASGPREVVKGIRARMDALFAKVRTQKQVIADFNEQIQSRASTFGEISATVEELRGSSENIAGTARSQLAESDGNAEELLRESGQAVEA